MKNCKVRKLYTIIAPVLVFVTLLFSCPLFVHGATDNSGDYVLPYAPGQIPNYVISSSELATLQSVFDDSAYGVDLYSDHVIIFKGQGLTASYGFDNPVPLYTVYVLNNPFLYSTFSTNCSFTNFHLFTDDYIDVLLSSYQRFNVCYQNGTGAYLNGQFSIDVLQNTSDTYHRFYGPVNVNNVSNQYFTFSYVNQYPYYCNGDFETIDKNSLHGIFLTSNLQTIAVDPQPVDPSWPSDPTPTPPQPDFPSPPSNPTVENLLAWVGSCINYLVTWFRFWSTRYLGPMLRYIVDTIKEGFNNLVSNLINFFRPYFTLFNLKFDEIISSLKAFATNNLSFLSDIKDIITSINTYVYSARNYIYQIVQAIQNIKTFFDTIIDLGTSNGVFSFVTLFSALFIPSQSQMVDMFQASDTFALATAGITIWNKIFEIWNTIKGLEAIKILHVPSVTYHGVTIGGFDIDFSWYQQFKSYGDGIISAFLYFSYFWFLVFRLPTFIRGQSAIFSDSVTTADAVQEPSHFKGKIGF